MSDLRERFQRATGHFGGLVHQTKDDQWGDQTPCTDWDVRTLVNHLVYEARWAVPLLEGQTIAEVGDRFEGDLLGDDPGAAYDDARAAASAAVSAVDLDRIVHLSFGDLPASDYLTQLTSDFVVHAWDLARGIGADDRMDVGAVDGDGHVAEAGKERGSGCHGGRYRSAPSRGLVQGFPSSARSSPFTTLP